MKSLTLGVAALAILATPAGAETRYDRKLEQAVMEIVAKKMTAELRGSFGYDQQPVFVPVTDDTVTGSIGREPGIDVAGLTIARPPYLSALPVERFVRVVF